MITRIKRLMVQLTPAVLIVVFWQLAVLGSPRRQFLYGSPLRLYHAALEEISTGVIFRHAAITLFEAATGLVLGTIVGTVVALTLWLNRRWGQLAQPYIVIVGSIPVFALAPMLILWFGVGMTPRVVMAAFSVCLIAVVTTYNGAKGVDERHADWLYGIGASRVLALRSVVVPELMLIAFQGLRLNIGFALVGAFIGEFVVSEAGLGHFILRYGGIYDVPRVLLGVAGFAAIGLLMTFLVAIVERTFPSFGAV